MKSGYLTGKVGNIEYDCPSIGQGAGGNNTEEYTNISERYNTYVKTFLDNVCNDPKYITTKTTKTGQKSIQFVWKSWGATSKKLNID